MPEISVIIPTYNRSHLLERAVSSVLAQSFQDFEIIIIDDASTDDTKEMVNDKFSGQLNSGIIRYVKNSARMERSSSRNVGIKLARGRFIGFLDDDDTWMPEHLSAALDFLHAEKDVGCVFSNFFLTTSDDPSDARLAKTDIKTGKGELYRRLCIIGKLGSPCTAVLRNTVLEKVDSFDTGLSVFEDREFFSRVAMNYSVGFLAEPSVCTFQHSGSYSQPSAEIRERIYQLIEENSRKYNYSIDSGLRAELLMDVSHTFMLFADFTRGKAYFLKALRVNWRVALQKQTAGSLLRIIIGQKLFGFLKGLKSDV